MKIAPMVLENPKPKKSVAASKAQAASSQSIIHSFPEDASEYLNALIEFSAGGFANEALTKILSEKLNDKFDADSISVLVEKYADRIALRRAEIRSAVAKEASVSQRLVEITGQLKAFLDAHENDEDSKAFAAVLPSYLRSIELLGKILNELRDSQINIVQVDSSMQLSVDDFKRLEDMGVIVIKNPVELSYFVGQKNPV